MKPSSAPAPRPPLSRARARNCLLVNQFATPGLGSLMGRRYLEGLLQLALAVAGFLCFCIGIFQRLQDAYREVNDEPVLPHAFRWLGTVGVVLFAASWLLAWITSLSLVREAKRNEAGGMPIPPKLGA